MKIKLNYCFIDKIKDIKENMGPLKVIRNNRHLYFKIDLPLWTAINLAFNPSIVRCLLILAFQYGIIIGSELLAALIVRRDIYKDRAQFDLLQTLLKLRDINVNTDLELLLESQVYERHYRLTLNEKKLPILLESKYIMVPSHGFDGVIKDTSVLQEHVVGSKKYVLSQGSPIRAYKFAPANA